MVGYDKATTKTIVIGVFKRKIKTDIIQYSIFNIQ